MKFIKHYTSIDSLGRVLIPIGIRRQLELEKNDEIDIVIENNNIILKKAVHSCTLCGSEENLVERNSKYVCKDCIDELLKNSQ